MKKEKANMLLIYLKRMKKAKRKKQKAKSKKQKANMLLFVVVLFEKNETNYNEKNINKIIIQCRKRKRK